MWNTGYKYFENRRRLINGFPDGYQEPNTTSGGLGPYIPPVIDYASCPTTSTTTTSTTSTTTSSSTTSTTTTSTSTTTTTSSTTSTSTTTTTTVPPTFSWIEDTYTCEQETPFVLVTTVTSLSSPANVYYDEPTGRFYVVDLDDVNGNLWYFDPNTFTSAAGRNYVTGSSLPGQYVQSYDYSDSLRKVFLAGPSTSGVYIYNIATNNLNLVSTGSNAPFNRLFTKILNNIVYSSNTNDGTLVLIDPVSESVTSTINVASIPGNTSNKYFNTSYMIYSVNGELWVCAGSYRATSGNIARYDASLTNFIGEIVIPGVTPPTLGGGWSGGFWQSQFYDQDKNRFYLTDVGSKRFTVIDTSNPSSPSIIQQFPITNLEDKNYAYVTWDLNPVTGELYANKTAIDNPSDGSPKTKFYKMNRDTYVFESMYLNSTTSGLKVRPGTNELWSASPGVPGWAGTPGWNTDGRIFKYVQ